MPEDGYKEQHRSHYMKEISGDISFVKTHHLMDDVPFAFKVNVDDVETSNKRLYEYIIRKHIL